MSQPSATPDIVDGEFTVEETAITLVPMGNETPRSAVTRSLAIVKAVNTMIDKTFVDGVHYGKIPGTARQTLLLPGIEAAMGLLQVRDVYVPIEVVRNYDQNNPFFYYEYECQLFTIGTNIEVGRGIGACNSREAIFMKTKNRKCPNCGEEAIFRSKFPPKNNPKATKGWYCNDKAGGCGANFDYNDKEIQGQETGSVFDAQYVWNNINNIVKKAKKRALGDAVKRVAMLSERFTVDMEDYLVYDDAELGNAESSKKPEVSGASPTSTGEQPAQNKVTQLPESGKPASKPTDEPKSKAWHEDESNVMTALKFAISKGWLTKPEPENPDDYRAEVLKLKPDLLKLANGKTFSDFSTGKEFLDHVKTEVDKLTGKNTPSPTAEEVAEHVTTEGTKPWHKDLDAIDKIVKWAAAHGFGATETELVKLLGGKDWSVFADGKSACEAIAEAFKVKPDETPDSSKKGSLSDNDLVAIGTWLKDAFNLTLDAIKDKGVDLSKYSTITTAKTMIRQYAEKGAWPVVCEAATYYEKAKYIAFKTEVGEIRHYSRSTFAKLVGQDYVDGNGIETLPDGDMVDIEPIFITWEQKGTGDTAYKLVKDAMPILEPEFA